MQWNPIFAWIPVETIVKEHQQEYYDAIALSDKQGESTPFVSFMLHCLYSALQEFQKSGPEKTAEKIRSYPPHWIAKRRLLGSNSIEKLSNQLVNHKNIVKSGYLNADSVISMNLKTPEFYQDEDFRAILWRAERLDTETDTNTNINQNDRQNDSQNDRQNDRQKFSKRQSKILRLIDGNSSITAEELAQKMDVSVPTIYRDLKSLHIKWSGPAKTGHWVFEKKLYL